MLDERPEESSAAISSKLAQIRRADFSTTAELRREAVVEIANALRDEILEIKESLKESSGEGKISYDFNDFFRVILEEKDDSALFKIANICLFLEVANNPLTEKIEDWEGKTLNSVEVYHDCRASGLSQYLELYNGHLPFLLELGTIKQNFPKAYEILSLQMRGYTLQDDGSHQEMDPYYLEITRAYPIRALIAPPLEAVDAFGHFIWSHESKGALEQLADIDPRRVVHALNRLEGVLPKISEVSEQIVKMLANSTSSSYRITISELITWHAINSYNLGKITPEQTLRLSGVMTNDENLRIDRFSSDDYQVSLDLLEIFYNMHFREMLDIQKGEIIVDSINSLCERTKSAWGEALYKCFSRPENFVKALQNPEKFAAITRMIPSEEQINQLKAAKMLNDETIIDLFSFDNPTDIFL